MNHPLAALRHTLDQAAELLREGLIAPAALRLAQLSTEAGQFASDVAADALNALGQPPMDAAAITLVVPQGHDAHLPHADTAAS